MNKHQHRVNPMTTIDFITELFCKVDDQMAQVPKHPRTLLWPSEAVTIGLLYAIKGTGAPGLSIAG